MMPAMTGVNSTTVDRLRAEEGSSATKVLADYAAMQRFESPHQDVNQSSSASATAHETHVANEGVANEKVAKEKSGKREIGGRDGPEPTRFGDWEKAGRCIDF